MILLDTHILLSVLGQVDLSLPPAILNCVKSKANARISVATIWEIAIKYRLGKLKLTVPVEQLQDLANDQNITILPVRVEHTLAQIGLEPITNDPFDRLLLGVCAVEGMKLLTIDKALASHPLAWR